MKLETTDQQIIPYSHHYRCFPQMVGSVVNQAVFMYLLDEYICRLKTGRPTEFIVSVNEISQKRNMTWRTVTRSLSELQTMGLITIVEDVCSIHANKFVSLVKAFHGLEKTKDKKRFIAALTKGDYIELSDMGLVIDTDGNSQLLSHSGGMLNDTTLCKIAEGSAKKQKVLSNSRTLCQMTEPYAKKQKVLLKSITIFEEIRRNVQEKYSKLDFIDEFREEFLDFLDEEEFGTLVHSIFDENDLKNVVFGPEFVIFLHAWVLLNSRRGFCHLAEGVMLNSRTVNKEELIENKEPENFEFDKTSLDNSLSGYHQLKKRQQLPFFPANEVEEYISDIRNCLDRADKIYINQVWEIAHECYDQEALLDENGKELSPANDNIESVGVIKERLMKDILLPAFDKTQEIIEHGSISVNGEEYMVTAVIGNPDDFGNIIDWELQTLLDGENYIISTKRVRNIYGAPVEPLPPRSVKRDNREDDMGYMHKIILIGDDDSKFEKLTPIELVVYNFLNEFFNIVDNGIVEEPKHSFINRTTLGVFYMDAKNKGVSETEFLSILSKDKPDSTGSLNLRQRMFSAEKIRKWNRLHSVESIVDSFEESNQ